LHLLYPIQKGEQDFPTLRQLLIAHVQINRDLFKDEEIADIHYDLEWAINDGIKPRIIYMCCNRSGHMGHIIQKYDRIKYYHLFHERGEDMLIFSKDDGREPRIKVLESISHPEIDYIPLCNPSNYNLSYHSYNRNIHDFRNCKTCLNLKIKLRPGRKY